MDVILLDFAQLEFFTYGFIGVVWTRSLWFTLAITHVLWFGISWTGIHRNDPDANQFAFHVFINISMLLGVWTGAWWLWAFRTPFWIDTRFVRDDGLLMPVVPGIAASALTIVLGYFYANGNFSETVPQATALGVGITLLVVGTVLFVGLFVYAWITHHDAQRGRMNVKYLIPMMVLFATSAIYDFLFLGGFDVWHGAVLVASLIVIYALIYVYIVAWKPSGEQEVYTEKGEVVLFVVGTGVIHTGTMFIAWLVDIGTDRDVEPVVATIGAMTIVWTVALVLVRVFWSGAAASSTARDKIDAKRGRAKRKQESRVLAFYQAVR